MAKQTVTKTISFTLEADDSSLLEQIKQSLEPTHGKVANIAVVRMALRAMMANLTQPKPKK